MCLQRDGSIPAHINHKQVIALLTRTCTLRNYWMHQVGVADLLSSNTGLCWPTGWWKAWGEGWAYGDYQPGSMTSALGICPGSWHSLGGRGREGEREREKEVSIDHSTICIIYSKSIAHCTFSAESWSSTRNWYCIRSNSRSRRGRELPGNGLIALHTRKAILNYLAGDGTYHSYV